MTNVDGQWIHSWKTKTVISETSVKRSAVGESIQENLLIKGWDPVKLPYAVPVIYYGLFQGGTFTVILFVKCSVVLHL